MKTTWKRSHKNDGPKAKARRRGALERLEEQVKSYERAMTKEDYGNKQHPWHSKIRRGRQEIEILKARI